MEDSQNKRYYWLKLKRDFFKRHDIQIIESMPNGKDYVLFYLKLLVESVDHCGNLRFSDTIPYNEQMLSTITNTNIDIVRSALKIFLELCMIDVLEDNTIYMAEVEKLLGSEGWSTGRTRKYRENLASHCDTSVTYGDEEIELDKEIEIEIESEKENAPLPPKGETNEKFNRLWISYPKKVGKGAAEKAFRKYKPDAGLLDTMLKAIDRYKQTDQWKKNGGEFIPNPATWLNQRRWEDEIKPAEHRTAWAGIPRV